MTTPDIRSPRRPSQFSTAPIGFGLTPPLIPHMLAADLRLRVEPASGPAEMAIGAGPPEEKLPRREDQQMPSFDLKCVIGAIRRDQRRRTAF